MPEFILIPYDVDENHINTFTDVKPLGKGVSNFGRTVKTLYNATLYNRIFNIRHKIAGNGSASIKIPSL